MALVISAVLTNSGRQALAQSFGGTTGGFSWSYAKYFKIGVANYTGSEPNAPSVLATDIYSVASGAFYYRKSFIPADVLFISPSTIQFRCFLDTGDANGNSFNEPDTASSADGPKNSSTLAGNAPVFYELGIFDPQNVLIAYGTFPGEAKLNTKTLNHLVNINF